MISHKEIIEVSSGIEIEENIKDLITEAKMLAIKKGLKEEDIQVVPEQPFPVEGAILILITLSSQIAYDIWKEFILPELKKNYKINNE